MPRFLISNIFLSLSLVGGMLASAPGAELKRYVYVNQPDGSTAGGPGSGRGILVLDIDRKFSLVKRITTPGILKVRQGVSAGCGMRGIAIDAKTARLYYTWHQGGKPGDDGGGCLDLRTDQVVWERSFDFTCERWQLSPCGKTLYNPCHWTDGKSRQVHTIDAATGEPGRTYDTGKVWPNHPLIVHPDGSRFYVGDGCFDIASGALLWTAKGGFGGTCHKVMDAAATRLYTGRHPESDTVATWVLDAATGAVVTKVLIDRTKHPEQGSISEVVAFEPDGKHFWGEGFTNKHDDKKEVVTLARYDATTEPPTLEKLVSIADLNAAHGLSLTSPKGHAMVTGAGDYAWFSCGAVLEAQTGTFVCTMSAEGGKFTRGAKYVEATWIDEEMVWSGQDECHGFIFTNYPMDRVLPLLPAGSPLKRQSSMQENTP